MADEKLISRVAAAAAAKTGPAPDAEQVTQKKDGDVLEARSTSRRIKTVEDLLAHIEADMTRFEVAASEATKWECANSEGNVTELHRVFVRLRPKAGPTTREVVEAMIEAAKISSPRVKKTQRASRKKDGLWQVLVIADTHVGRYCWAKSTGDSDFDVEIAGRVIRDASSELLDIGDGYKPVRRTILFLGDLFNSDGPGGATTAGTPQDNDGRIQKVWNFGCDALLGVVERSAMTAPTDVLVVNGNHDEMLSWAFQRVMRERFRNDERVRVSSEFTRRQYVRYGANLLGAAHGDKAKKHLPQLMAIEAAEHWSKCWYREYHTGHLHGQAAEKFIASADSVVLRTAPSIAPADEWHAASGYLGSRRGMECFIYKPEGGLVSMHVAGPSGSRREQ